MSLNEPRTAESPPRETMSHDATSQDVAPLVDRTTNEDPDYGRMFAGLCLIGVGVLLWLTIRGTIEYVDMGTYWPLILVAIGCSKLLSRDCETRKGGTLIALGVGFLLFNLGLAPWPMILVVVGVVMLARGLREGRSLRDDGSSRDGRRPQGRGREERSNVTS